MITIEHSYQHISSQGMPPPVFVPDDVESCRHWITQKHEERAAVLIAGGTTHWFLGGNPVRLTDILSVRKWSRVLDHSPGDLTVTVESGCPMAELNAALEKSGQFLPLFPVGDGGATVGGIVATGLGGPYSGAFGGPRDFLIGIQVLHPEGILSHAGGRVVKNAAGYDLCKLYTGSLGTLGIISKLTFKVQPLPQASLTCLLTFAGVWDLLQAALRIRDRLDPAALEMILPGHLFADCSDGRDGPVLAVRFRDSRSLVDWKKGLLSQDHPKVRLLNAAAEEAFWNHWNGDFATALRPTDGHSVLRAATSWAAMPELCEQARRGLLACALTAHLRSGVLYVFLDRTEWADVLPEFRTKWFAQDVGVMVFKATPELKTRVDVWGLTQQPVQLMRQIKAQFDPRGILNPGRLW